MTTETFHSEPSQINYSWLSMPAAKKLISQHWISTQMLCFSSYQFAGCGGHLYKYWFSGTWNTLWNISLSFLFSLCTFNSSMWIILFLFTLCSREISCFVVCVTWLLPIILNMEWQESFCLFAQCRRLMLWPVWSTPTCVVCLASAWPPQCSSSHSWCPTAACWTMSKRIRTTLAPSTCLTGVCR